MYPHKKNKVVDSPLTSGINFFNNDLLLRQFAVDHVSAKAFTYMNEQRKKPYSKEEIINLMAWSFEY